MPCLDRTEILVEPPPMSTIMVPSFWWSSSPMPIMAARGWSMSTVFLAPTATAASRRALLCTLLMPLGTHIMSLGWKNMPFR